MVEENTSTEVLQVYHGHLISLECLYTGRWQLKGKAWNPWPLQGGYLVNLLRYIWFGCSRVKVCCKSMQSCSEGSHLFHNEIFLPWWESSLSGWHPWETRMRMKTVWIICCDLHNHQISAQQNTRGRFWTNFILNHHRKTKRRVVLYASTELMPSCTEAVLLLHVYFIKLLQ